MHRRARSQPTIPTITNDVLSNRISSLGKQHYHTHHRREGEGEDTATSKKSLEIYRGLQVEFPKFYEEMLAESSGLGIDFWRLGSSIAENSSSIKKDSHQEARILNCIGNIHFQRQEFDLACEAYVLAKECYEKLGEEYISAVAVTLSNIGTVAWRCHDYEAAQEFFEESLRILTKQNSCNGEGTGETDDMIADAHHNLGLVKSLMEDYKGAKDSLEKALSIRRNLHGKFSAQAARTLDVLGTVYMKIENKSVAMIYYSEALFTKKQILGEEHPSTLISLMNVASVYKKNGELDHALSMYEKVLALQRKRNSNTNNSVSSNDPFSLEIGITMHTIADIKLEKMSLFGALSIYRDAGDIYKKAGLDRNDKRYVALRKSQLNAQKLLQTTQTQLFLIREQSTGGN